MFKVQPHFAILFPSKEENMSINMLTDSRYSVYTEQALSMRCSRFTRMANTLVVLLAFLAVQVTLSESLNFRWCYIGDQAKVKCSDFIKDVKKIASNLTINVTVECVAGEDADSCMKKIENDAADLVTLDGGRVFTAGETYGLIPVMAEEYGKYGPKYYAVAVAKKSNLNLALDETLRGKKTCHTGARRTAGWNVPIGYLLRKKVIPKEGCENDTQYFDFISVGKFFNQSCVPGSSSDKYNATGKIPSNLCSLCAGSGAYKCSPDATKNKYASYHGAFKCMADGAGDVAFVKHTTVGEVVNGGGYGNLTDYKYLCKNGETKDIGEHENCNLGFNPAHAVVTRANYDIENIVKILAAMSAKFGVNQTDPNVFQLFNSTKYGGSNLLFKDSTTALSEIKEKTYQGYLTEDYVEDATALRSCDEPTGSGTPSKPTEPGPSKTNMAAPSVALSVMMALVALLRF